MSSAKMLFVRESSGLVKPLAAFGAFIFTFSTLFHPWFWTLLAQMPNLFPGMSLLPAILIGGTLQLLNYGIGSAMLIVTMPRAGANYVTISRSVHPLLGGIEGYRTIIWNTISAGVSAYFGGMSIGLFLVQAGIFLENAELTAMGSTIGATPIYAALIGVLFILVAFALDWTGLKYLKVLMIVNAIVSITVVVLMVVGFLSVTPSTIPAAWDGAFGSGAYNEVVAVSNTHGYDPAAFNFNWTSTASSFLLISIFLVLGGTYTIAGEVENPKKNILLGVTISGILMIVILSIVGYTMMNSCGELLTRYNFIYFAGAGGDLLINPVVLPSTHFYGGALLGYPMLAAFMCVPIILSSLNFMATNFYWTTRPMFAMAMDRLLPEAFTKVSPKYHTPSNAILFALAMSLIALTLSIFIPYILLFSATMFGMMLYFLFAISQVALPLTRPEIYAKGYTWSIMGFPLLSGLGLWNTGWVLYMMWASAAGLDTITLIISAAFVSIGMGLTAVAMNYRQSQGIDLRKLFGTVPPE